MKMLFSISQLRIIEYCAEEVEYQKRGPEQVAWMLKAWDLAFRHQQMGWPMDQAMILGLGMQVELTKNDRGYRTVSVSVNRNSCPLPYAVPELMKRYIQHFESMTAQEAYVEFEQIHPFIDGNGRVGKIIYNWKNGTLSDPKWPKDIW